MRAIMNFPRNFIRCGLVGWCMEIIFTSLSSLRRRDYQLKGETSIWMFPIYGCAALLSPISHLLHKKNIMFRGIIYMLLIFSVEFVSGSILQRHSCCPWNYGRCKYHIRKVIRLDYAPYWFGAGLLFERLLWRKSSS